MSNKRCPKCGFPRESETSDDICPCCGWNVSSGYEEVEMTYKNGNSTIVIRFNSEKDVYYEYTPNTIPLYEDAWGKYYLGKCYSKRYSRFLRKVTVCLVNSDFYVSSMWRHIKEKHIDFSGTAFIPIIDYISCSPNHHYMIEDHYDGVSLYDLMRGKVCGVDNQPIGFAVKMYEMYQNRKIDFAKMVVKKILKEINIIHSNDMALRFIELPENIIFTVNGEIKIRIRGSLLSVCKLPGAINTEVFLSLLPVEYAPALLEEIRKYEKDESFEVYVIGILLYCILTGHLPYKSRTSLDDCHKAHELYVDPRDDEYIENPHFGLLLRGYDDLLLDEIQDEHLKIVIKKATQLNPSKRFQSVTEFIKALEERKNVHIPWYRKIFGLFYDTKNRLQCVLLSALFAFSFYLYSDAQNTMRINYKDGSVCDIPIERIDSVTFVEKTDESHEATLVGEWFWGDKDKGYFEVLTFNEDWTYTGYDYYLEYGFDTWTYGMYMANGIMLNLWSNGYGYRRTYRWFVSALTENALEVITQMGSFTYYRVQPEIYSLKVGEESYKCSSGDYYVFTDGIKVSGNDGKLKGISEGTSYILKYDTKYGLIMAYKVIVEK